jgi:hypothetical protein
MLTDAIAGAVAVHQNTAESLIDSSTIEIYIRVKAALSSPSTGASMFADLDDAESATLQGPFKSLWVDADSARVGTGSREGNLIARYSTADVVIKVKLSDVLIDTTDPYGQTYFDQALDVVYNDRNFQVLGYDRYGLGTVPPYIIAVALRGGYES